MSRVFVGTNSEELANDSFTAVTTTPFSMACWFNAAADSSDVLMALGDKDVDNMFHRLVWDTVDVVVQTFDGTLSTARSTGAGANGQWTHACGVWASASSRTAYRDGANADTNTQTRTVTGIDAIAIGSDVDSTPFGFFDGQIYWPAIWNIGLSALDVARLARGVSPLRVRRASLLGFWPLFSTTGDVRSVIASGGILVDTNTVLAGTSNPAVQPTFGLRRRTMIMVGAGATTEFLTVTGNLALTGEITQFGVGINSLAGTLSFAGTVDSILTKLLSVAGTLVQTGTLVLQPQTLYAGALNLTGTVQKEAAIALAGATNFTGTVANTLVKLLSVAGSLAMTGVATMFPQIVRSGTLTQTGTITKQVQKTFSGTLQQTGTHVKLTFLTVAGVLSMSGTVVSNTLNLLAKRIISIVSIRSRRIDKTVD